MRPWFYHCKCFLLVSLLCMGIGADHTVRAMPQLVETLVKIHPTSGTFMAGDTISVEVWVENITDLYGADVQLKFDPLAFQVLDANPSAPGDQITVRSDLLQPGFVIHQEANNQTGLIWYANSQVNPALPVSGSGALFAFVLLARANGTFLLDISSQQLSDKSANPISASEQDAIYILAGYKGFLPFVCKN